MSDPAAADLALAAYQRAMQAPGVPQEDLDVYSSNSFHRIGLTTRYSEQVVARSMNDGQLTLSNPALLEALVAAFNAMRTIAPTLETIGHPVDARLSVEFAAPAAKLVVNEDRSVSVSLYAPGLPPGEHNLFVEANHIHWDKRRD